MINKFVKIFRSVSQLTCEIVGTKDGPFFSINLCGVVKGIADELIGFWSSKLFFMSVILCWQLCLYFFLFSVFFCWMFYFDKRMFFFVISFELFPYLILSLINFCLCFFLKYYIVIQGWLLQVRNEKKNIINQLQIRWSTMDTLRFHSI